MSRKRKTCISFSPKVGIDKYSKEEIDYRELCLNSLKMFNSVNAVGQRLPITEEDICQTIAERGQMINYLSDKVIEADSSNSHFGYIITKGSCYVIRLLDLNEHEGNICLRCRRTKRNRRNEGRSHILQHSLPSITNEGLASKRYSSDSIVTLLSPSLQYSRSKITTAWTNGLNKTLHRKNKQERELECDFCPSKDESDGRHVFLKVAVLQAGQSFGMSQIFQIEDCRDERKFSLVSASCEMIRVPKAVITVGDESFMNVFRGFVQRYPTDVELYSDYKTMNTWRGFREGIVTSLLEKRL